MQIYDVRYSHAVRQCAVLCGSAWHCAVLSCCAAMCAALVCGATSTAAKSRLCRTWPHMQEGDHTYPAGCSAVLTSACGLSHPPPAAAAEKPLLTVCIGRSAQRIGLVSRQALLHSPRRRMIQCSATVRNSCRVSQQMGITVCNSALSGTTRLSSLHVRVPTFPPVSFSDGLPCHDAALAPCDVRNRRDG